MINKAMIREAMIRKVMIKKTLINETIVCKALMTYKAMINKVITINKVKNNTDIYDKHIDGEIQYNKYTKKKKNTSI